MTAVRGTEISVGSQIDFEEGIMHRRAATFAGLTALVGLAVAVGRARQLRWGATWVEVQASLPGDDIVAGPGLCATRAASIAVPPERVWPWIIQLGQGRAGFYSYDWLENLVGCDIHNADQIVPEWQHIAVGEEMRLHPELALRVAVVDPGRALVAASPPPAPGSPAAPYDFTWAFVVEPTSSGGSRLLVRERYAWRAPWARALIEVLALASFVMTERMLRGIRTRAEGG
jgi:hypothetical protein